MEDEFYASIKLVSGEEIFSLVTPSQEEDRIFLILQNPVTIETVVMKNINIQGYKIDPWIKFADDDTFLLNVEKILTISEVNDPEIVEMYQKFLRQKNGKKKSSKLTSEMGYLSTVAEARIRFEKLYRALDKPNS
jgi:hypothetical protein